MYLSNFSHQYTLLLSLIPISLGGSHLLGLYGQHHIKKGKDTLRSFSAGFSVAYVFLILLPELPLLAHSLGVDTALYMLLGFAFFHVAHKYVFKTKQDKLREILNDEIHLITAAVYSFLIAFSLVELAKLNLFKGLLLASVIVVHTMLSEISYVDVNESYVDKIKEPILVLMTFLGGLLAILDLANLFFTALLFSISAGGTIYIAIREEIPQDSVGKPTMFLVGVLLLIVIDKILLIV